MYSWVDFLKNVNQIVYMIINFNPGQFYLLCLSRTKLRVKKFSRNVYAINYANIKLLKFSNIILS